VAIRRERGLGSDGHFSNRVLHGSRLDDRVVPVGVGDEHDAPVLLLVGGARLPLVGRLGLALQAEPLVLAAARELGLGDLGHGGPAHASGLAVGAPRRGGELLLLQLGEAAVLGALLGVLLAAARRARRRGPPPPASRPPPGRAPPGRGAPPQPRRARAGSALVLTPIFFGIAEASTAARG
jgi:hypothetical protein